MILYVVLISTTMVDRINFFISSYIAVFRPNKRTYYIFKWNADVRKWHAYTEDIVAPTLHKTSLHANAVVELNIHIRRTSSSIQVSADGHYLKSGDKTMTVLKKTGGNILPMRDHPAVQNNDYNEDRILWQIKSPVQAKIDKIPTRIAWIIAEDAAKRDELCPISMETISPITSSVTSCFHIFLTDSLKEWFQRNEKLSCPLCRKVCTFTEAFDEAPPLAIE
jgi:hypothetical protein